MTSDALRKIAFLTPPEGALAWTVANGANAILGVAVDEHEHALQRRPALRVLGPGALTFYYEGRALVSLQDLEVQEFGSSVLPELTEGFGAEFYGVFHGTGDIEAGKHVLGALPRQRGGGAIWVVEPGREEEMVEMLAIRFGFQPQNWQRSLGHNLPHTFDTLRTISAFAGIDGAILVDSRMELLGAGVFANLSKVQLEAYLTNPDGSMTLVASDEIGGGRHRSAVAFCRQVGKAYALVVSEDGRVTAISNGWTTERPIVRYFQQTSPADGAGDFQHQCLQSMNLPQRQAFVAARLRRA